MVGLLLGLRNGQEKADEKITEEKTMPELSIIVPVYKVEKYLPKCIDSILAQTFRDFELILIDDGSPDRCGAICDEYAAKDSRIKVIHQQNAGVSAARNAGLDIATGTYLGFVDSDDWIEPEMYETMITTAKEKQVDVVVCGLEYIGPNGAIVIDNGQIDAVQKITRKELYLRTYGLSQKLYHGALWNKIILRETFSSNRLSVKITHFEDWLLLLSVYENVKSCILLPESFYHYTTDAESNSSKRINAQKIHLSFTAFYRIVQKSNTCAELRSVILERFLDDSTIYTRRIRGSKGYFRTVLTIKCRMLKVLVTAYFSHSLEKTKIHKYFYEGVICAW